MPARKAKPRAPKRKRPTPRKRATHTKRKRPTPKRKPAKKIPRAKRYQRAEKLAAQWYERERVADDDEGPDVLSYPWDRDEGWEPEGGWQGDDLTEEISFMTHEEKIEFFEYLAEQLDTTVHELFEMAGSP